MLEIKNLHVNVDGREILKGLDLTLPAGEVHAIMGPNGSGKSTLAYVLAGKDDYEVTAGSITWNGQDLLDPWTGRARRCRRLPRLPIPDGDPGRRHHDLPAHGGERGAQGARGEGALDPRPSQARAREGEAAQDRPEMLKRPLNVGFSGGEKKRNEILQMSLLEPSLCVLDETDSGLDIDAIRIVADGVNALRSRPERSMLVITHYQRLLDYIVPDRVHVLSDGRVARSGGPELALELEQSGYAEFGGKAA